MHLPGRDLTARILLSLASTWPRHFVRLARRILLSGLTHDVGHGTSTTPRLLVDVSIIAQHDGKSGIQRAVSALLSNLLRTPPPGWDVRAIEATRRRPYRYADTYLISHGVTPPDRPDEFVEVRPGDLFLGLDLTSRILPSRQYDLLRWRRQGVRFAFVVYDLLPAHHPHWFTPRGKKSFARWLPTIAVHGDALFCISRSVARDVRQWTTEHYGLRKDELQIDWFHLGADLSQIPDVSPKLRKQRSSGHDITILMVGTIEPRKGHDQALDAFEILWAQGFDVNLVIVGKPGWNTARLIARLETHSEAGRKLHWLRDATDAMLTECYETSDGMLMASLGEGFGLPIVEAAARNLHVLARDLPVFREIGGDHITYFSGTSADDLSSALRDWVTRLAAGTAPDVSHATWKTWAESAAELGRLLEKLDDRTQSPPKIGHAPESPA